MYGMIAKITAAPGKRDQIIQILGDATVSMPGCLSYIISKDAADENLIWVTEYWDTQAGHDDSLKLPRVQKSMVDARPLIAGFDRIAVLTPARGIK